MPAYSAISVDTSGLRETLRGLRSDQIPYAMQLAVNDLAKDTIRVERIEMQDSFDRPTPFVLRGLRVAKWASKQDPTAAIWFKDVFGKFGEAVENTLRPQIEGGPRAPKSTEVRLRRLGLLVQDEWLSPGGSARLNAYGNVSGAAHVQMLSYFRAFWEAGYNANRRAGASASRRGKRFFVQKVGGSRGIFEVTGKGRARLVWYIAKRRPTYRERFDFFGEAARHAAKYGPYFAGKAAERALRTARSR